MELNMELMINTIQYQLKIFNYTYWVSTHSINSGWFRLFGKGLSWRNIDIGLSFSERMGVKKYIIIGNLIISGLK